MIIGTLLTLFIVSCHSRGPPKWLKKDSPIDPRVQRAQEARPNIVFILADDMGYGDPGFYSVYPEMNSHYKLITPNLNWLGENGMIFTDAYAGAPVCAPSRCTLITGKHSGHCTVRDNGPYLDPDPEDISVATVLKNAGYDTAMFGKWGLGTMESGSDPVQKGFDKYIGQWDQENCHNYYPPFQYNQQSKVLLHRNQNASYENCDRPDLTRCDWTGDIWTGEAIAYLSSPERDHEKPFFLFLSYTTPHAGNVGTNEENGSPTPRQSEGPYFNRFNKSWPWEEIEYATAVTAVDELIGQFLTALDSNGLTESTLVLFASDNGASDEGKHNYAYFASSGPLSGYKRSLKEGGHRSPFIANWPGFVPPGVVTDHQMSFYDFMATVADLAGVHSSQIPENDGYSALLTLLGIPQAQPDFVYHEYCQPNENKQGWGQAVRMGDWVGLCIGNYPVNTVPNCEDDRSSNATFMLYDLSKDIHQNDDVAGRIEYADIKRDIYEVMRQQHKPGNYCQGA